MTVAMTWSASPGIAEQRHALLAVGSGLTGLAAIKVLKFAQLNITDALVFVTGIAARSTSHLANEASRWTPFVPAAVTASVLIALAVLAVANIAELITAEPDSSWISRSTGTSKFVYATTLYSVRDR